MATTVTWILDANSKYEVSSKEHLIQIMNDGAIYANTGDVPTPPGNQWGRADYIQTADIDLLGDSTNIRSMGFTSNWAGEYDGNGFTVSNWVYVEVNFPNPATTSFSGVFCAMNGGTVKNFRLAGVCSLSGFTLNTGFICDSVFNTSTVSNIEVDLSPGSFIAQSSTQTGTMNVGTIFGRLASSGSTTGITFKGQIDSITSSDSASNVFTGGLVGWFFNSSGTNTLFRNLGTFPSGLTGNFVGGVVGAITNSNLTKALNAMTGDITNIAAGSSYIGGVIGELGQNSTSLTNNEFVNSMTGNITGDSFAVGGVIGRHLQESGSTVHSLFNYMTGDVTNTANDRVGGMIADGDSDTNITTSINAMSGHVRYPTTGDIVTAGAEANIDTSFGLTYEVERNITTTPLGLPTDPATGLPVFDLSATDPNGVVLTFDFVFGNIPPPVVWVLDANGKHEISSKEHLIQLMHAGTLYANEGTIPTSWLVSDYIQTVDIDLLGDSTNIAPIGIHTSAFLGEYDGNGFSISNWSYVDPDFATDNPVRDVGLFGFINGATVKNVTLDGVCTMSGFRERCGMVVGNANASDVFNIDCNLSSGSFLTQSTTMAHPGWINAGTVLGNLINCTVTAITFRGVLDHLTLTSNSTTNIVAGVVARVQTCTIDLMRNLGTFPSGLSSNNLIGGVAGEATGTMRNLINGMTGDLVCNGNAGGVAGLYYAEPTAGEFINSMKGNITGGGTVGGVIGFFLPSAGSTMPSLMNYMAGDITASNTANRAGGIIGDAANTDVDLSTSINAMNGDVYNTVLGKDYAVTDLAFVDTSYGLTFTVDAYGTTTPITGIPTDPGTGLPVVVLTATDADSVVHTFDFVFGNLPRYFNQLIIESPIETNIVELEIYDTLGTNIALLGTASSPNFHASGPPGNANDGTTNHTNNHSAINIPTNSVSIWTLDLDREYTLSEINKVVFYNRDLTTRPDLDLTGQGATISFHSADGDSPEQVGVLTNDLLQEFVINVLPEFLLPTAGVTSISATVVEVTGALTYLINITESPSGTTRVAHTGISTGDVTIGALTPETTYVLQLYADTGSGYALEDTELVTTLANSAENYDTSVYGSDGVFDLSTLDNSSFALLGEVLNDVFTTGDKLEINLGPTTSAVAFVKVGEAVSTEDSILVPFSTAGGAGQAITMNLSDTTTVAVSYDDVNNALTIGSEIVQVGDSTVIDGKKLTVKEL